MAYIFYNAINRAYNDNRLVAAAPAETIGNIGCDKHACTGIPAGARTQQGSGEDDGLTYTNRSAKVLSGLTVGTE